MSFKETEIGMLPENWITEELGNLVQIKGRVGWKGYKTSDLRDSGPIVLGGINIKNSPYLDLSEIKFLSREKYEESPEIKLMKEDILLVTRGNGIGDVSYFDGSIKEATINPSMVILSNFKGYSKFLYYYLVSSVGKNSVLAISSGSSIPAIYQKQLAKVKFPYPPLGDQKKISNILSFLDDKIETDKKINETLHSFFQLLFKHWFIDFEFPDEEGLLYKSSGGEMVVSELGIIPKGWEVKQLKDVKEMGTLVMGQSPSGSSYNQDKQGLPLINGAADIKDGNLVPNKYTTEPKKISKVNDLVFCIRATIGLLTISDGEYCLGRGVACLTDIEEKYYEYIYQIMDNSFDKFEKTASGSVYINLSKDDFNNMRLIMPSIDVLEKYHHICAPILKLITSNKKEIAKLSTLRDTLLLRLMSGEIDLSNLQID